MIAVIALCYAERMCLVIVCGKIKKICGFHYFMFLSNASNCAVPALTSPLGGGYRNNIRHILELTSHFGAIKKKSCVV